MPLIVVSGPLANKPGNGGAAWTRLSWALGLRQLGCDVYFVEQISPTQCVDAETRGVPVLRVARIEIQERPLVETALDPIDGKVAADIDEQIGGVREVGHLTAAQAGTTAPRVEQQRRPIGQPEMPRDLREVREVDRAGEVARAAFGIDALSG